MILLADSGSTKTDWRLIHSDQSIEQYRTLGLNPYFNTQEDIQRVTEETFHADVRGQVKEIHFYGAGCGAGEKAAIAEEALGAAFSNATVSVFSDMMGAARATAAHGSGMVAILGTGSNSCVYDGKTIVEGRPSLGYVLGDEGAGTSIGKALLKAFLEDDLPEVLHKSFAKKYDVTISGALDCIYKQPLPNRYLASFAKFAYNNIKHPEMQDVVVRTFRAFFEHTICKYENHEQMPLHIVGSVGFYHGNILRRVAAEYGVNLGIVLEAPISGLTLFHSELDQ